MTTDLYFIKMPSFFPYNWSNMAEKQEGEIPYLRQLCLLMFSSGMFIFHLSSILSLRMTYMADFQADSYLGTDQIQIC